MSIDWRIYYGDGSTFDSSMGGPEDAPPHDVICVLYASENGGQPLNTWDWYIYREDVGWWGVDKMGMIDQIMHFTKIITGVKQGRCVPDEDFQRIMKAARNDTDIPVGDAKIKKLTGNQRYGPGKTE